MSKESSAATITCPTGPDREHVAPSEGCAGDSPLRRAGVTIEIAGAGYRLADGTSLLDGIDLHVEEGELVAVVGTSGAGKSTLLDLVAGHVVPTSGRVSIDGVDAHAVDAVARRSIGFVPQHDTISALPLITELYAAARLRLPVGSTATDARHAAVRSMERLHLNGIDEVPLDRLSGGQRRRASIAVELLTDPRALLLDEPTSGLDPDIGAALVSELRRIADQGTTVVMTTHHPDDLLAADRIVVMAPGGRIGFDGTFTDAAEALGTNDAHHVHRALTTGQIPDVARRPAPSRKAATTAPTTGPDATGASRLVQGWTLVWRALVGIRHQRLTAGIMVGAPAAIIAMFAVLFRSGEFGPDGNPAIASMVAFWLAFAGFFFGLTSGLLQICPEVDAMRREHRAGVPAWLQVAAKLSALTPVLLVINTATLGVLVALDRIPWHGWAPMVELWTTLGLEAVASLALGLLVSAAVRTPVQTSLALPMLCFPAVLFAGAMVPVDSMAGPARAISVIVPVRWAFEAVDASLDGLVNPSTTTGAVWVTLIGFLAVFVVGASVALERRLVGSARRA